MESRGPELGILLEGGAEERHVGVELTLAHDRPPIETRGLEGGAHGVGVQAQLARNGADTPVLGVEEASDLGALGLGDHARPSPRSRAGRRAAGVGNALGIGEAQRVSTGDAVQGRPPTR